MRNIFDPYESLGDDAMLNCPAGQIGAPALGVPCQPIPGYSVPADQPVGGCPAGQLGWPSLGIPCTTVPGIPSSSQPQAPGGCPPGQLGWPSNGIPCMTLPQPTMPGGGVPGVSTNPNGMPNIPVPGVSINPNVTAPPMQQPAAPAQSGMPSWVIPVAIGGGVLLLAIVAFASKKKHSYAPNRYRAKYIHGRGKKARARRRKQGTYNWAA